MSIQSSEIQTAQVGKMLLNKNSIFKKLFMPWILGAIFPFAVLLTWQVLGDLGYISNLLFPTPYTIFKALKKLIVSGELFEHLQISVIRVIGGFALGGSLGLAFGLFVGLFKRTEKSLNPSIQMIRMIPAMAVAPLFILWFGFGEASKIYLIAKGAFFPLYINTFIGIRNVDNKFFEVAKILEFSKFKQIIRLIIPAALPNILLGVRISLGVAWLGLVVAELIGASEGIGYLMSDARQFGKTPVVFVGILMFAIVGIITDTAVRLLERKLLSWQDNYRGQ
ncbi:ABC transporter permease [Paenibacillus psychroresistens]|uniref:ABC transporter permease n=2 Tax=Paenibacillus psychroresistens TaxID=1778678 RepID=A0A6B8RJX6_9BACL|nr:ABC transporter permease [Paenibacillus psychroresistens]